MHASAPGLDGLSSILPQGKAALARRLVVTGRAPEPKDFDKQGLTLTADELGRLSVFLETGLRTRVVEEVRSQDGTFRLGIGLHDGKREIGRAHV